MRARRRVLGTFIDHHDNPRFLNGQSDVALFKNAIAAGLTVTGIPIFYYGDEQEYAGGSDPGCRETLWPNYNTDSEIYQLVQTVNKMRKDQTLSTLNQTQRYADDQFYAFTRGNVFIALTNTGTGGNVQRSITYHPYSEGTKLCSVFNSGSCVSVSGGAFSVSLQNGLPDILVPQ
mmetsp:Transcript_35123/g.91150  ORF Transcript_35123/g.91150 Transcript_35123/m.91150 type:complete len:175 (+) Transcript_35123:342-866(+)